MKTLFLCATLVAAALCASPPKPKVKYIVTTITKPEIITVTKTVWIKETIKPCADQPCVDPQAICHVTGTKTWDDFRCTCKNGVKYSQKYGCQKLPCIRLPKVPKVKPLRGKLRSHT